jgi:hypothetical protein
MKKENKKIFSVRINAELRDEIYHKLNSTSVSLSDYYRKRVEKMIKNDLKKMESK